jgi:two-component system, LuxR family, sensor kinase FixL
MSRRSGATQGWTSLTMHEPAGNDSDEIRSRLAAIVESSDDSIISKDLDGIVTSWNSAAERLFGFTAVEMVGQPITIIFPLDRVDEEAEFLRRVSRGEKVEHYETIRHHKDGHAISVSVTISPIRDTNGRITGASKIIRDLTQRDARERRIQELQAELAHVQRLTELGQVVSALVHEVNQPLTAISNYASACRRLTMTGNIGQIQSGLENIANQAERARQVVQRIREFVKKGDVQMRAEHLPQVIEEIIVLTQASVREEGLRFTTRFDPMALSAEIDKVQVHQVLFNLLRNGIEALHGQPKRELVVATRPVDGDMVEISVADNGSGLPDQVRAKLFQPFVTTKANGMGVGLSVCQAIIGTHGGRLWAEDNPGGGTVFRFTVRRASLFQNH